MKRRLFACITALCLCLCCVTTAAAYTNDELCDMAKQHYKKLYGQAPPIVRVESENEFANEVTLQLCEYTLGHTATWDRYTVNRISGKGTAFMGESVDLSPYAPGVQTRTDFPFQDVKSGDSRYESIRYVYQSGLFSGTNATTFSPNGSMNRAMLTTVLYRLEGKPAVNGYSGFNDVKPGSYYESAAIWASARGIVTGTSGRSFSPQNPITHEQLAVMLYRYAVLYLGMDASANASLSAYPDGGQVGAYAQKAIRWCVSKGLITGGKLSPKSNATRAEVAEMLYRLSKLPQGAGGYKQALEPLLRNAPEYGDYNNYNSSLYYDVDGNGTEELLTIYFSTHAAVHTLQNGRAVRLINERVFELASAPYGELGVMESGGNQYLCIRSQNHGGDIDEEHNGHFSGFYKVYSLSGTSLALVQDVEYSLIGHGYMIPPFKDLSGDITIKANGQTQTTDTAGFVNWLNSWTWKTKLCVGDAMDG